MTRQRRPFDELRDIALFVVGLGAAIWVITVGTPFDPYATVFLIVTMLGLRLIWKGDGNGNSR